MKQFYGIAAKFVNCIGCEKDAGTAKGEIGALIGGKLAGCFFIDHMLDGRERAGGKDKKDACGSDYAGGTAC